jgi:ethanolamine ammonia-lyase large subunit
MPRLIGKFLIVGFVCLGLLSLGTYCSAVAIKDVKPGECVSKYVERIKGKFDQTLYQQVIGAANPYKEGDEAIGVAADDDITRVHARMLLANTKIKDLHEHPLFEDNLQKLIWKTTDKGQYNKVKDWTMGELKNFLLTQSEADIKSIMHGLNSDVIASVTKLMSNPELVLVGRKVFNPLPGSKLGAKGYMSARIQPNSPQDDPEDIQWQVFDAWSYATGDLVIGTNPVDGTVDSVNKIQTALRDVVITFGLEDVIPWCVLAHIDDQAACEVKYPGSTSLWFQSLAGCDDANATFGVSIEKMMKYAKMRKGQQYGLYHETGQGADFTNGAGNGFDMVVHESRKYGFSKALQMEVAKTQGKKDAWCITNDVAGFIGPEVFKTREQLVRCCLEDIVMGKLHGLCLGLDICSTLHMPVSLTDLDWCIDQIMPANPPYLMALPTKNDPMLSYLTTGYQDHVRLRHKFGYKVNDAMWDFFKRIGIVDKNDKYTEHLGDPIWVYYQYRLAKGDTRSKAEIYKEGEAAIKRVEAREVRIARGHGKNPWDLDPELDKKITALYNDAKVSLWAEFTPEFISTIPNAVLIATNSKDREDYVAHPSTGEELSKAAVASLEKLRDSWGGKEPDVQIVISDGLNSKAIMDEGHLEPYLKTVKKELKNAGLTVGKETVVVKSGRVRAGYAIGDVLFGKSNPKKHKVVLHIIGERPGTGHHNFSCYIAAPKAETWAQKKVDHDIVKAVCGISNTALQPVGAAKETVRLVKELIKI